MFRKMANWLFYFKTGSDRRFPGIVLILISMNFGVLLVPETTWGKLGIDVTGQWNSLPEFMQYYLVDMEHKNAAYVFWLMLPFTCFVNTVTLVVVFNLTSYERFLKKRKFIMENRLTLWEKNRKSPRTWRSDLFIASFPIFALYIWGVFIHLAEPSFTGEFIPTKNRLALLLFVGGMPLIVFPLMAMSLVAEARAAISEFLLFRKLKSE